MIQLLPYVAFKNSLQKP